MKNRRIGKRRNSIANLSFCNLKAKTTKILLDEQYLLKKVYPFG